MKPQPMLAVFIYEDAQGKHKEWTVGCMSTDTEQTMREHFERWMPDRKMISLKFEDESHQ